MSGTVRTFHAYRGTNTWEANRFIRCGRLWKSKRKNEYFGHGVYFFENSRQEAYNFAHLSRKLNPINIRVFYALIEAETTHIFDLLEQDAYDAYIEAVLTIVTRYDKGAKVIDLDVINPVDCRLLNDICEREGYKLVRGPYNPNHCAGRILRDHGITRIPRTHIQLCVRDEEIIKEIKIV